MEKEIIPGSKVRDKITGFEGVVVAVGTWMEGCARVLVHPQTLKDGKPEEGQWFDLTRTEFIEKTLPYEEIPCDFQFGDQVTDPICGFKGIVTGLTVWVNERVEVGVTSQEMHDGKPIKELWFPMKRLETVKPKKMKSKTSTKNPGGPRDDAPSTYIR